MQRRTLFGFSRKEERKPKEPDLRPGFEVFVEFSRMQRVGARLPPVLDLVRAWRKFFDTQQREKRSKPVNHLQALHVLRVFNYIKHFQTEKGSFDLSLSDIRAARRILLHMPNDGTDAHQALAIGIHDELIQRGAWHIGDTKYLVEALTLTGETVAARDLLVKYYKEHDDGEVSRRPKVLILEGFAKENNELELVKMVAEIEAQWPLQYSTLQRIMTCFYAERDNVEGTKKWFEKPEKDGKPVVHTKPETLTAMFKFSIRNNELNWCKEWFRKVIENDPTKEQWDVILQWAAGAVGKGVEDVERMMEVMRRRNPNMQPDIVTINGLVELAISQNDPYLAERYIALGRKSGIHPNARTFILQMNYRVAADDLRGAHSAYEALQSEEILFDEDLPAINHYLRALCASKTNHYDRITSILQDLDTRHTRLEAPTVSAIAMLYMQHSQLDDVYDLLQTNTYHYTLPERTAIRTTFVSYVLDRANSNARAWDAYQALRQIFDETDVPLRTSLMTEFFNRGRADMATHVFGHMRQHPLPTHRPILATYVSVLLGIARLGDSDCLDTVHNMLKLDSNIEPNTQLYNALMLAYASVGDGHRALHYWDDITNSGEGPSYRSLEIVFRACENTPFGDLRAREIWGKMRRMEIEVTRAVWGAYVGALAGRGRFDAAKEIVENGESEFGLKADALT